MPKHLLMSLENFLKDSVLTSWNIQSGNFFASVTIRFRLDGGDRDTEVQDECNVNNIKYRRVSAAQQRRDRKRAKIWEDKKCENQGVIAKKTIDKQKTCESILQSSIDTEPLPTPTCSLPDKPISSRTRSRLNSSAPAFQPKASPVCQVDGTCDSQDETPVKVDYKNEPMPDWVRNMLALWKNRKPEALDESTDKFG